VTGLTKQIKNLWPDLSAARPQAGTYCRDEIGGARSESRLHPVDGRHRRAMHRAAPSGMGGSDDGPVTIGYQDRRAIGDPDADRDRGIVGHRDVRLGSGSAHVLASPGDRDLGSMHLSKQQHPTEFKTNLAGNRVPLVSRVAQFKVRCREEVISDVRERTAT
jgi:hypothetical protein